jgi:Flp pilus assembly protein TadG
MTLRLRAFRNRRRRFWAADRGVAAVEFAVLLPFMLLLYMGTTQLVHGMIVSRKLSVATRTLADVVAQQPQGTNLSLSQINDIIAATNSILAPYSTQSLMLTVSGIDFVATAPGATTYNAKTKWSVSRNGGALRPSGTLTSSTNGATTTSTTVPTGIYGQGSVIAADVSYTFTPSFGGNLLNWIGPPTGSLHMTRTMFMRPRVQTSISYSGTDGVQCP